MGQRGIVILSSVVAGLIVLWLLGGFSSSPPYKDDVLQAGAVGLQQYGDPHDGAIVYWARRTGDNGYFYITEFKVTDRNDERDMFQCVMVTETNSYGTTVGPADAPMLNFTHGSLDQAIASCRRATT